MKIKLKIVFLVSVFFLCAGKIFSQQRRIQVPQKQQIESTETYKILKKYKLTTQEYPRESEDGKYFYSQVKDVLNVNDGSQKMAYYYFVVDDGKDCYLRKLLNMFGDVGIPGWGINLPEEIKITKSIKEVLSAYENNVLKYVVMLITLENAENLPEEFKDYSVLLEYNNAAKIFGIPLENKKLYLAETTSLEGEISDAVISSYPNYKWYIETF